MSQCKKCHSLQPPVVQKVDSTIHWINHYPMNKAFGLHTTYPLDTDFSGGWRYPFFKQPGPGVHLLLSLISAHLDKLPSPVFSPRNC